MGVLTTVQSPENPYSIDTIAEDSQKRSMKAILLD